MSAGEEYVVKTLEKVQKSNVFIKVQEKHEYFEKK